jgi:hypothetical protein
MCGAGVTGRGLFITEIVCGVNEYLAIAASRQPCGRRSGALMRGRFTLLVNARARQPEAIGLLIERPIHASG